MSRYARQVVGSVLVLLAGVAWSQQAPRGTEVLLEVRPAFAVAGQRVVDIDRDGTNELLVVGREGEVRVLRFERGEGGWSHQVHGSLVLEEPRHSLLALVDVEGDGSSLELVVAGPKGVYLYRAEGPGLASKSEVLARRARFPLRVGLPTFADICQDVNGDGKVDLVLPVGDTCELWLQTDQRFRRSAVLTVDVNRERSTQMEALSDQLIDSYTIPHLSILDLNGDGRPDLHVADGDRRDFYLQREDSSLPDQPDVRLNLEIFQDTTPEANVRLGRTLAGTENRLFQMRDLDGDWIPDYVIAHRRKAWVFHGTSAGPQFVDPRTILIVAQDITALRVVALDDDEYPDLLLVRLQVPSVATLLAGALTEWDVDVSVLDYQSVAGPRGRTFAKRPRRQRELTLRLPAWLGVLRNPEALMRKLEGLASKFRESVQGDFTGDGKTDIAIVSEAGDRLELWGAIIKARAGESPTDVVLRNIFFEDRDPVWNLDRILAFVGSYAEESALQLTGGRPPDVRVALRVDPTRDFPELRSGDLNGDGRAELIVCYGPMVSGERTTYEIIRVD